jgi:hypothetical protein
MDKINPDELLSVAEAGRHPVLLARLGKPVHQWTIINWIRWGVHGTPPLKSVSIAGRRLTTASWLEKFLDDTTVRGYKGPVTRTGRSRRQKAVLIVNAEPRAAKKRGVKVA